MDKRNKLKRAGIIMLSCSAVPMLISGGYGYVPNFSDRIVYSAARELSWDPELDAKSAAAPIRSIKVSTGAADLMAAPEEIEVHRPEGIEIPTPLPSQQVLDAIPYPDNLTDHDGRIEKTNFGSYTGEQYFDLRDGGQVRNCTWHTNEELLEASTMGRVFDIETGTDEPQILIYHTHTTECFELEDKDWYDSDFGAKTTEADKNITAVGNEICKQLEASGISVIHDTLVHDYPSYDAAYDSSRETVSELLEQYPSIKIALDIHRDGIETAEGVRLAPTAEINGKDAAQIMIISGCDDGTFGMPDYMNNFRFACELQSRTETMFEGLTRPILFDYRFYNQDLTDGSLLIEVGSHGNTLDQAKYSGELIGKALAALLCE